jgi:hypothetical protein
MEMYGSGFLREQKTKSTCHVSGRTLIKDNGKFFLWYKELTVSGIPYILSLALLEHPRADSSAVEHLPYTQGVTGSNPVSPTKASLEMRGRSSVG